MAKYPAVHFEIGCRDQSQTRGFYVQVEDVAAAIQQAIALGGKRLEGPVCRYPQGRLRGYRVLRKPAP